MPESIPLYASVVHFLQCCELQMIYKSWFKLIWVIYVLDWNNQFVVIYDSNLCKLCHFLSIFLKSWVTNVMSFEERPDGPVHAVQKPLISVENWNNIVV